MLLALTSLLPSLVLAEVVNGTIDVVGTTHVQQTGISTQQQIGTSQVQLQGVSQFGFTNAQVVTITNVVSITVTQATFGASSIVLTNLPLSNSTASATQLILGTNAPTALAATLTTSTNFPGFNKWQTNADSIGFITVTTTNAGGIGTSQGIGLLVAVQGGPTNFTVANGASGVASLQTVDTISTMISNRSYWAITNTSSTGSPTLQYFSIQNGF